MKKFLGRQLALLLALILTVSMLPVMAFASEDASNQKQITIHVLGDSTTCEYASDQYPQFGLAQAMAKMLNENVTIENHASGGSTSRRTYNGVWTYVEDGPSVKDVLKEGDYVFIQFGHNDGKTPAEGLNRWAPLEEIPADHQYAYDYENTYYWYMQQFIDDAKAKGAIPVILTSIRRFADFKPKTTWTDEMKPAIVDTSFIEDYAAAAREIAEENDLVCIDMYKMTADYILSLDTLGEAKRLYLYLDKGESPNWPDGAEDHTHLCENGATVYASLARDYLKSIEHPLSAYFLSDEEFEQEEEENKMVTYMNETFDNYTTSSLGTVGEVEYTLIDEIEGKFSYYPNKETGINVEGGVAPTWYTKIVNDTSSSGIKNGIGMSQQKTLTFDEATFFKRTFEVPMDKSNTRFSVDIKQRLQDFTGTKQTGTTRIVLNNTNGEDLVTFDLYRGKSGSRANIYLQNVPDANGTHTRTLTTFKTETNIIYESDQTARIFFYPDFKNKTISIAATNSKRQITDLLAVDVPMSIPESGVYNFGEVLLGGIGADGNGITVIFDNILASTMVKEEREEFANLKAAKLESTLFVDDFEWGTPKAEGEDESENTYTTYTIEKFTKGDYTTAVNGITKVGSSITAKPISADTSDSYRTADVGGIVSVTIEDGDGDHGQVLQYKRETPEGFSNKYRGSRGIYLSIPNQYKAITAFSSVEFDYKPMTKSALAQYIETCDSANNKGTNTTWQNPMMADGFEIKGDYYTTSTKTKTLNKKALFANYLPAEMLDEDGTLKLNEWYKIKYVFDFETVTYDVYLNGYLIAVGCPVIIPDINYEGTKKSTAQNGYTFKKVLIGDGGTGEFACQIDNFKVQVLTAEEAVQALKAGFEKNLGDGVIRENERKTVASGKIGLVLPYQGAFGFNSFDNGAYKIADADNSRVTENRLNAPINYTLPSEYTLAANGKVFGDDTFTENGRALVFYDNIALHKAAAQLTDEQKSDTSGMLAPTVTVPSLGGQSGIGMGHFNGDSSDVEFKLTATFKKGNVKIKNSYAITFKRDLMESITSKLEVGAPVFKGVVDGQLTEDGYVEYRSSIAGSGANDPIIFVVLAGYDTDDNICFIAAHEQVIESGLGEELVSVKFGEEEGYVPALREEVSKVKVFIWGGGGEVGLFEPVTEIIVSEAPANQE